MPSSPGIYGYRAGFIRRYVSWQPSPLEHIEMLEQLRVLWYGEKIHVAVAKAVPGTGVDTADDRSACALKCVNMILFMIVLDGHEQRGMIAQR